MSATLFRIGVDTGGTFTDLVLNAGPAYPLFTHKLLSTPARPEQAVLTGIQQVLQSFAQVAEIQPDPLVIHGSTVATNALLEGKGARTAFVTTAGFEDTLHIARQNRPDLYALAVRRPDPPIRRAYCLGVEERILFDGQVLIPLKTHSIEALTDQLRALDVEAVAVSLLHSYANPVHERRLADHLRERFPDLMLTVSHELLPEFREYERAATCIVNAVVAPAMTRYLNRLRREIGDSNLRIMVSSGGSLPTSVVCDAPVHTILSGPAGGVLGAWTLALEAGHNRIITLDMGGTSTDVSLCRNELSHTTEHEIAGLPIRLPMVDIHTVGAGGGSIAWVDGGGALRVGPRSAGADPGPACYGKQTGPLQPTVTDAHVVLGHLQADVPLGGDLWLDQEAARRAVSGIADALHLAVEETALGILKVAEATMARAVQRISVQRGFDPRDFVLVPFGGAGGLHACRLADSLGITEILIPRYPGLLSALGMLTAAPLYTFSKSQLLKLEPTQGSYPDPYHLDEIINIRSELEDRARRALGEEGIPPAQQLLTPALDLRYRGQAYEITVSGDTESVIEAFIARHQSLYGYVADKPIEVVTVRLRATTRRPELHLGIKQNDASASRKPHQAEIYHNEKWIPHDCYARDALRPETAFSGPAVVTEYSSTTVVPPDWLCTVTPEGHLFLRNESVGSGPG